MNELSRNSATPGGGSVSALSGALSASLISMVIALSSNRNLDKYAIQAQNLKADLLLLIEEDAKAFDIVMQAFRRPKKTREDKERRLKQIENSYKKAVYPPISILEKSHKLLNIVNKIDRKISNNCMSDLGVSVEMASASVNGAIMNININLKEISDKKFISDINKRVRKLNKDVDNYLFRLNKNIEL